MNMHSVVFLASAFVLAGQVAAVEATSFKVDFGFSTGNIQEGWNVFGWSSGNEPGPLSNEYDTPSDKIAEGRITVSVAAGASATAVQTICARRRDGVQGLGEFDLLTMYRDWVNPNDNTYLWVTIAGLKPKSFYTFKAYAYDDNNDNSVRFNQILDGSIVEPTGLITYVKQTVFTSETKDDIYADAIEILTDTKGTVVLRFSGSPKPPLLSGFELIPIGKGRPFDLTVDFGGNDTVYALYDGAKLFYAPEGEDPRTITYENLSPNGSSGSVTVGLSFEKVTTGKRFIIRDRKDAGIKDYAEIFPYYNLYRDLMIAQVQSMVVDITGLTPNAKYDIMVDAYDYSYTRTYTLADWTFGTDGKSVSIATEKAHVFTNDTPMDVFALKQTVKADATGAVKLNLRSNASEVGIAWLKISYLKPTGMSIVLR